MVIKQNNYKRTMLDCFISVLNSLRYSIIEPVKLAVVRMRYEQLYSDPNEDHLVSIMIPTYNHGQLLIERTLPSIFAQTYQNFEVVIVGDHCVDNTPELIAKLNHPKVRFYNLNKRGSYPQDVASRWFVAGTKPANKALKLIRGKWIAWLDDDDVFTPDHIEMLLRFAQEERYEFVAGLYEEERNGKKTIVGHRSNEYPEYGGHSTWLYRSYLRFFKYNVNSWRKNWNRPGDIDLQLRMRAAGVRMGALDNIVTYVLPRPGSSTVGLAAREIEYKKQ
jgi:glycosyltransferase involved in cell wall biosynthesis